MESQLRIGAKSCAKAAIYSDDETTLVCLEDRAPAEIQTEKGWVCLRTVGPFPFDAA